MPLKGLVQAVITAQLTKEQDLATTSSSITGAAGRKQWTIKTGTGANQGDEMFHDQITLAQAAFTELDLSGTLLNAFGDVINFARIKTFAVYSADGFPNTANLIVGGAAANPWDSWVGDPTDKVIVGPDGLLLLAAPDATGYLVTAGSKDKLLFTHDGSEANDFVFDLILIGATA